MMNRGIHVLADINIVQRKTEIFKSWKGLVDMGRRVWIFVLFQKKKFTQIDVRANYISVRV